MKTLEIGEMQDSAIKFGRCAKCGIRFPMQLVFEDGGHAISEYDRGTTTAHLSRCSGPVIPEPPKGTDK